MRTSHQQEGGASARRLWAAAATVRLRDSRLLGPLIRARIPGLRPSLTFAELFRSFPFNLLDEGRTYTLSGLCGRIWTVHGDFAQLSRPSEFLTWRVPGTVRVLFANWAETTEHGAALASEVRIAAVDRRAAFHIEELRPFISAFEGLVATEPLRIAVERADHSRKR